MAERTSTRAAYGVMACTAASRLFGYVKMALIGALFGSGGEADVLWAVYAIPNNLRRLFAEGAISAAFVPALTTALVEEPGGARARALARALMTFQLLVLGPLILLSVVWPEPLVRILLRFAEPEQTELAAGLLRWMLSLLLSVSLAATVMAVLNVHRSFMVSALSPLVFSVAMIGCMLGLHRRLGPYSMAVGVALGGVAQLCFQLPAYFRTGYDLKPSFRFSAPDFRKTLGRWVPYVASASIFAVVQQVAILFATALDQEGGVAAINNAVIFLQLPLGVFTASVMTVLFPAMSRQAASGDTAGLRETAHSGMDLLTALLVPSAVFLALYGRELIMVALERGKFTSEGTLQASHALTGYAVGLLSLGLYSFMQRLCYAQGDFRAPVVSAAVVAVTDVLLSLLLTRTRLRTTGLAYANSVAFTAGLGYLLVAARRRLGRLGLRSWLLTFCKAAAATIPLALLSLGSRLLAPELGRDGNTLAVAGVVLGVTVACIAATLGMLVLLRVPGVSDLFHRRATPAP